MRVAFEMSYVFHPSAFRLLLSVVSVPLWFPSPRSSCDSRFNTLLLVGRSREQPDIS